MNHPAKPHRHQTPEHRKVAQAYGLRLVIGKRLLILLAGVALATVLMLDSVRSPLAIGTMVFGGACVLAFFVGDFPAAARCPGCGRRLKVRTHQDPHPHRRWRYLECPQCHQTIDLDS